MGRKRGEWWVFEEKGSSWAMLFFLGKDGMGLSGRFEGVKGNTREWGKVLLEEEVRL
jgi:hypothetical protein